MPARSPTSGQAELRRCGTRSLNGSNEARLRRGPRLAALVVGAGLAFGAASVGAATNWASISASGGRAQARMLTAAAPTGVTASCASATTDKVTVSWAAASHATGYTIYKKKTSGSYTSAASVTTTSWTSGALTSGRYTFEVATSIGTKWTSSKSSATSPARTVTKTPKKCS
jgi:hypothetical protein